MQNKCIILGMIHYFKTGIGLSKSPRRSSTGTTTPPAINQAQPSGRPPNQQHQFPTWLQHNQFEGAISELCGHIYDLLLVGIRSANLFTMTTHPIATYMGRELSGDICCSC